MTRRTPMAAAVLVNVFACAGGCTGGTAGPTQSEPPLPTIQELMNTRIDPAADVLWDAVAFISSEKGEEERRPRTPAEWLTVQQNAQALIAAAADLTVPGRRVALLDKAAGPGGLDASDIQRRIDADRVAFAQRARALESSAQRALAAIDAKDADALMNAGGLIDAACEACHVLYWYPQQTQSGK